MLIKIVLCAYLGIMTGILVHEAGHIILGGGCTSLSIDFVHMRGATTPNNPGLLCVAGGFMFQLLYSILLLSFKDRGALVISGVNAFGIISYTSKYQVDGVMSDITQLVLMDGLPVMLLILAVSTVITIITICRFYSGYIDELKHPSKKTHFIIP